VSSAAHAHRDRAGVVSSVDGRTIAAEEVAKLAEVGRLQPQEALRKLQAERLLAAEADRRGYAKSTETQRLARQALVQTLLARDVEANISDARLEAAYEAQKERFEQTELRRSKHLLVALTAKATPAEQTAARVFVEHAIAQLQASQSLDQTLDSLRRSAPANLKLRVEQLPPAKREGSFVAAFSQALFSLAAPAVVPEPVRTEYGYHAIVLTEIIPPKLVPKVEAFSALREELETSERKQRLDALMVELQNHTRVTYAQDAPKQLAALEL
jgi:peptidyl-prolyl cis-trans isomerase C